MCASARSLRGCGPGAGRYNIELGDRQFESLMKKIDANDDGLVSYQEFLNYFRR